MSLLYVMGTEQLKFLTGIHYKKDDKNI